MRHDHFGTTEGREPESSWRSGRKLLVFALVSLSAHAAVIVALPEFFRGPGAAQVSMLEVTILKPEPLAVAEFPPEPTPPRQQAESKNKQARVQLNLEPDPSAPVLAEPPPPALDPNSQMTGAAAVPPITSSALLNNPVPRYPLASRRSGEQGTVTLRVLVTREGLPARVDVEKSSGSPHLDAAALQAVKAWWFMPARQGQDAIESWMLVPVVFRLEGPG